MAVSERSTPGPVNLGLLGGGRGGGPHLGGFGKNTLIGPVQEGGQGGGGTLPAARLGSGGGTVEEVYPGPLAKQRDGRPAVRGGRKLGEFVLQKSVGGGPSKALGPNATGV